VEGLALEGSEALHTEFKTGLHELDIWPLLQGIIDDRLVLVDRDRTGRVDDIASRRRGWRGRVQRTQDELFLQMRQ
jgi:hypothetical protein